MSAANISPPGAPLENDASAGNQAEAGTRHTMAVGSTRLASLQIRCPVCREPFSVAADQPLHDLHCTHCQRRFCLADDGSQAGAAAKIGHFELLHCLGMGGFGTVWKARDTELDRVVAIKIPRQGRLSPTEMEEFVYEARVAAQLRHSHIVPVYEIGRDGDDVFIVSELVDGCSLSDFARARRMTPTEAAEICATVADALHFAHAAGVVHRDLKPGNILIDKRGVPHITDFGLAIRASEEVSLTVDGAILGTPAYMSPEQARGDGHLADRRSDVYSMGVILFELLTDDLPFRGNLHMLLQHSIGSEPPSPRTLNQAVPHDLETICLKCLEKEPRRRFATAKELADELRRHLHQEPILSRPISAAEHLWRWCRKNPRIPLLSASLLLVLAIAYTMAWSRFEKIHAESDAHLTSRALSQLEFTSYAVAATAGYDFDRHFEAVERTARDPVLQQRLAAIVDSSELQPLVARLSDPQLGDAALEASRREFEAHELRKKLQFWIEALPHNPDIQAFAWFVTLPDGLQAVRNPVVLGGEQTIGRNYSWRAYHHGGEVDREDIWRSGPEQGLMRTQLSPAFLARYTNEWVVVISTPIVRDGRYLGVLGLMVRLGEFLALPGSASTSSSSPEHKAFAVLVDSRSPNPGQILQHPLYLSTEYVVSSDQRRELLDRARQERYRATLGQWTTQPQYVDPFAGLSDEFDDRWLAAQSPVEVRGQPTGLHVVVQESYDDLIGQSLANLRQSLMVLSIVTVLVAVAVVVPLWATIVRLVQ